MAVKDRKAMNKEGEELKVGDEIVGHGKIIKIQDNPILNFVPYVSFKNDPAQYNPYHLIKRNSMSKKKRMVPAFLVTNNPISKLNGIYEIEKSLSKIIDTIPDESHRWKILQLLAIQRQC